MNPTRLYRSSTFLPLLTLYAALSGCWFEPLETAGRRCRTDDDCLGGRTCVAEVCALQSELDAGSDTGLDAGFEDAGDAGPDAGPGDAGVDAAQDGGRPDGGVCLSGPRLALGEAFGCGLSAERVLCWGRTGHGQLGDPTEALGFVFPPRPVDFGPGAPTRWGAVYAGRRRACALSCEGELWCWGNNGSQRLGRNDPALVLRPGRVDTVPRTSISLAYAFSCGVTDSRVQCWGRNVEGLAGVPGGPVNLTTPTFVTGADGASDLNCGSVACCAQRADGHHCWGAAQFGTIASTRLAPDTRDVSTPVLMDQGDVPYATIRMGAQSACGIGASGGVDCWGVTHRHSWSTALNYSGILGTATAPEDATVVQPPTTVIAADPSREIVDLVVTGDGACVLVGDLVTRNRRIQCWGTFGDETLMEPQVFETFTGDWLELASSRVGFEGDSRHATICGLRSTGEVRCLGVRNYAESGSDTLFSTTGITLEH